jgi:hypothetical protein
MAIVGMLLAAPKVAIHIARRSIRLAVEVYLMTLPAACACIITL